jgi:hypothetical protein
MNPAEPGNEHSSQTARTKGVAHNTSDKVREAAERAKEAAADFADEQKERAADRIGGYGSALHETADSVRAEDPNIAWLTDQASSRLQLAADYVRNRSWSQLREDGADLARRHPVVFYGGMFVLGAAAGALIKAGLPDGLTGGANARDGAPTKDDARDEGGYAQTGGDAAQTGNDDARTDDVPGASPAETPPSVETKL